MRHLMTTSAMLLLSPLLLLSLTACGGGGGAGADSGVLSAFSTKTSGNVTALNGQSSDVAGVEVECSATGSRSTSDAAGHFDLGDLPADIVDIDVKTPGSAQPQTARVDLRGGGEAVLRLSVDDDGIRRMSVEHCDGDHQGNETRSDLTAVELGLHGKVQIAKDSLNDQKFEVEVEGLLGGREIEVFVADAAGVEESQGNAIANAEGDAKLELETGHGDVLPHAAADVADLEGFSVIVRDATTGDDLMTGTVPALGSIPAACTKHDDGDDSGHDGSQDEGSTHLTAAAGVTGQAEAKLHSRPDREKLEVEVDHTSVTDPIEFWLEDPASLGTFVLIGTLVAHEGGQKFELDTMDGDLLPFGVAGAADLVGLNVELRNSVGGSVLFTGVLPPLNPS